MKKLFYLLMVFVFSISLFAQKDNTGKKAINFKLDDIDGNTIELNKEIGSGPILISFWATWCKPCTEEMSEFSKIYDELKNKGLKLFAISIDSEKSLSRVRPYVKSKGFKFPVLLDTNSEVARKYFAQAIPYSVIIDKTGKIVYSHMGYMKGDEIKVKELILNLLK